MSAFALSAVVWLAWFGAFVALELMGLSGHFGWLTLSEFVWDAEGVAGILRWVFLVGLATLTVHLVARWP